MTKRSVDEQCGGKSGLSLALPKSMFNNRTRFGAIQTQIDGGPGPPATLVREPGQIRKEAATADDVCAGMWLGSPPI